MKTRVILNSLTIVAMAILVSCKDDVIENDIHPEQLKNMQRVIPAGVWEGDGTVGGTEYINVEIDHGRPQAKIISVEVEVLDDFHSDYIFVSDLSLEDNGHDLESQVISYDVKKAGVHTLDFYYQWKNGARNYIGSYNFAINN